MSAEMDLLLAAVRRNDDVVQSAVTAFQVIADHMAKAAMTGDTQVIGKLAEDLMANAQKLAAAIPANTSADVVKTVDPAAPQATPVTPVKPTDENDPNEDPGA